MQTELFHDICMVVFAIEIIVEIISIIWLVLRKNTKCWHLFFGIVIASIITVIVAMGPTNSIRDNAEGMSGVNIMISYTICLVANVLLLLIGLAIKKTMRGVNLEPTGSSAFVSIITLLINLFVIFMLPWIVTNMKLNINNEYVINYLTNRYGSSDYEVVDVETEYNRITKEVDGYAFKMKSGYMPDTFEVRVEEDYSHVISDMFLPTYHSYKYGFKYDPIKSYYGFSEIENYMEKIASEKYAVNRDIDAQDVYKNYIDNAVDNGRIPTVEEVVGWYLTYRQVLN